MEIKMTSSTTITMTALAAVLLLSACNQRAADEWHKDCDAYYSYDSRENAACKERLATGTGTAKQNPVTTDPEDAGRPIEGSRETEKARG
jgi:hypothetical protein